MRTFIKRLISVVAVVALLGVPGAAYVYRQDVYDWVRLRSYDVPSGVSQLAVDTTMTTFGRKLFYVNRPVITNDKDLFSKNCTQSEQTIVLGCYIGNQGIYLFAVSDSRLNGIEQVTAAHEMLHVGYDRLSETQRAHVDELVNSTYKNINNDRLNRTIAGYQKTEPTEIANELHSILGTEFADLPEELEAYYKKYFEDRQAVVRLANAYEAEFTARENKISDYDKQLESLKQQIETNQTSLDQKRSKLESERTRLDALKAAGVYDAYNDGVESYNSLVNSYNNLVAKTQKQIDDYNKVVKDRNNLATEIKGLTQAIDSRPQSL